MCMYRRQEFTDTHVHSNWQVDPLVLWWDARTCVGTVSSNVDHVAWSDPATEEDTGSAK